MKFLLLFISFLSTYANAEKGGGNGGSVGVCFNDASYVKIIVDNDNRIPNRLLPFIQRIEALDLLQAKSKFAYSQTDDDDVLILPKKSYEQDLVFQEYISGIANRFSILIPTVADNMKKSLAKIKPGNVSFYDEFGIDRIYDTGEEYYLDPERCVIATVIRQAVVGQTPRLDIDNRLFSHPKHSIQSQGVLFLHEVVLNWANTLGQVSTYNTRKAVSMMIMKDLNRSYAIRELLDFAFLKQPNFNSYELAPGVLAELQAFTKAAVSNKEVGQWSWDNFFQGYEKYSYLFSSPSVIDAFSFATIFKSALECSKGRTDVCKKSHYYFTNKKELTAEDRKMLEPINAELEFWESYKQLYKFLRSQHPSTIYQNRPYYSYNPTDKQCVVLLRKKPEYPKKGFTGKFANCEQDLLNAGNENIKKLNVLKSEITTKYDAYNNTELVNQTIAFMNEAVPVYTVLTKEKIIANGFVVTFTKLKEKFSNPKYAFSPVVSEELFSCMNEIIDFFEQLPAKFGDNFRTEKGGYSLTMEDTCYMKTRIKYMNAGANNLDKHLEDYETKIPAEILP